jgi:hypothetical protein
MESLIVLSGKGSGGYWVKIGEDIYYPTGNVGIGKVPDVNYKLDVDGDLQIKNKLNIQNLTGGQSSFTALDRLYYSGLPLDFQNKDLFNTKFGKLGTPPATPLDGQVWSDHLGLNAFVNNRISHFTPKDVVYVHSLADFPDKQVDGYIHLEEKHYIIMEQVILDADFGYKGFYLEKDLSPMITGFRTIGYENQNAGADAMFKSDDVGGGLLILNNLNVYSDGDTYGRLFNIKSTNPQGFLVINTFACGGFLDLGTIEDISYFGFVVNYVQCILDGLKLHNNSAVAIQSHRFNDWFNAGATFISISGTQKSIQVNNCFLEPKTNECCFYFDPTLTTTGGSIVGNAFSLNGGGCVFKTGSKKQSDIYWTYAGNTNLADSTVTAQAIYENTPQTSVTPAISAKVFLATSPYVFSDEERIQGTPSDGRSAYTGLENSKIALDGNIELAPTVGTNQAIRTQFMKIETEDRNVNLIPATNQIEDLEDYVSNNDTITFYYTGGTLPTGIDPNVTYHVVNKTGLNFQIAYTQGGTPVTFASSGVGVITYRKTILTGGIGRGTISSTAPIQLIPQALMDINTGERISIVVWNDSSITDINCGYAYYRIKK